MELDLRTRKQQDDIGNHTTRIDPIGIYVHWPFCQAKCPYCDFNSHVRPRGIDEENFVRALTLELDYYKDLTGKRSVDTIFIGGGTPSLLGEGSVDRLLNHIQKNWSVQSGAEITLEANPASSEAKRFGSYKQSGINRLSLGVQSLRPRDLKFLGRLHSVEEALDTIEISRKIFDRFSFDLIYARPDQTVEQWEKELREALALAGGHLSLYQLTIEPRTAFADLYKAGKLKVPDDAMAVALYQKTAELCAEAGLINYEISNYAISGHESRHNLVYWRYRDYLGIGPGAHGRLHIDGVRFEISNLAHPEKWLAEVDDQGTGIEFKRKLELNEQVLEFLIMGLRLREGISLNRLRNEFGYEIHESTIRDLTGQEMILRNPDSNNLRVSANGRLILNSIIDKLTEGLEKSTGPALQSV